MRSSLTSLKKAIKGLVVMDAELETLAGALTLGNRPTLWMKHSYPSRKPLGSYVTDMLRRLAFFQKWIDDVKAPPTFWVSGFFFTQAFLTGSMQNYARRNSVAIDSIDFQYSVLPEDPTEAAENGVYVYGLFLEGARYSKETRMLAECEPKVLFVELPMMWLCPTPLDDLVENPHYMCPLYKTSERKGTLSTTGHSTNFVMYLKLPSDQPEMHWVKRGVAGLTELAD